jgi:hypothetical protein
LHLFIIFLLAILIVGCKDNNGTSAPSQLSYAEKCSEIMGSVPSFNCLIGTEIPITKNGHLLLSAPEDKECDNKIKFSGQSNPCVPKSRLKILDSSHENVLIVAICRKYNQKSVDNNYFDDIAVIQHDKSTGSTCFYQSNMSLKPKLDGTNVTSPQNPNTQHIWTNISKTPCTDCHDADPFIWSPYIAQVIKSNENFEELWSASILNGPWHSNFPAIFNEPVKIFEPNGNVCTYCHRIGSNTCKSMMRNYVNEGLMPLGAKNMMPKEHSMFNKDVFPKGFERELVELEKCCKKPNELNCNTKEAVGKNVVRIQ